ncbi:MAG TPA: DUF488 family protein [Stellaceae bacterium]|jgi:uncharacterized protein YeaO (DUF488 family)|nr:DUF488 family protein [Stellaceae bacterium]
MAAKRAEIRVKRAYEPAAEADGTRVLVDRLWPRGVTKDALALARWAKEIGPSDALRRWFRHDPARWGEFRRRYAAELAKQKPLLDELRDLARSGVLTLVYGARDEEHNNAVVLCDALTKAQKKKAPARAEPTAGASTKKSKKKALRVSTRRAASRRARR